MDLYKSVLNDAAAKAEAANPRGEKDFVKDGILYCGICGAPKQTKASIPIIGKMAFVDCECVKAEKQKQADRMRAQRIETLRAECFDNAKMRGQTFAVDDRRNPEIGKICRNYVEHFHEMNGKGLVLFGEPEKGKTFFGCCIANALIDRGIAGRCTSFTAQATDHEDLTQYSFVLLDDFGAERDTSYMGEIVYSTIDTLYRFGIPFVLTTNLAGEQLKNSADIATKRILSRLHETCIFYEVTGPDRRRETLKQDTPYYKQILEQ